MKHIVIGTAGHIDHGKTALIKALSGFDGDTTLEEKSRGITINLSFSYIQNEQKNIAFIDVPGHEKLIKNMIAGAFGFDASLVIIDANEGIMPQSIEHLEILNLLEVKHIIIALTKSDLVSKEIINKQVLYITEFMKRYKNLIVKSIIPTSIYDEKSIEILKKELFLLEKNQKKSNGLFRYYVDRSFSLSGIGSVLTGTILDGEIKVLDKIFLTDFKKEVVIKNIQVHDKDVSTAFASQRVAINLKNTKIPLKKNMLFSKKGFLRGFYIVDVFFQSIGDKILKHNSKITFYIGTKKLEAKILLFDNTKTLKNGFARVEFKEEIFSVYNEPFIISISNRIIAGGKILNPINDPIKKQKKTKLLDALYHSNFIEAFKILIDSHKKGFGLISSNQRFGLNHNEALDITKDINDIFIDKTNLVIYPVSTQKELEEMILSIYKKNQFAMLSAKSIAFKIIWASENIIQYALDILAKRDLIILDNGIYRNTNIKIDDIDILIQDKIYDILLKSEHSPKAPYNIYDDLDIDRVKGDNALKKLTASKKVTRLAHNLFVANINLTTLMKELREIIKKEGYLDISIFKKYYNLSRKYAISYLENLDKYGDIVKDGTKRKLVNNV
jgi:selenocysteine-specific elongation factor